MKRLYMRLKSFLRSLAEIAHARLFNYMAEQGFILCSVTLPNGSLVAIAAAMEPTVDMSAITNANPGEATFEAAHGLVLGDIVVVASGWSRLTDKTLRLADPAASPPGANNFSLEGQDTTDTGIYPALGGAGTARKVTSWTQLSQILTATTSGGEQQFKEYQFLESDAAKRIPTFKSAQGIGFSIADDPRLPGQILVGVANDDRLPRPVRITLPNKDILYYNCYISAGKTPSLVVNDIMAIEVTLSLLAEPVRYNFTS